MSIMSGPVPEPTKRGRGRLESAITRLFTREADVRRVDNVTENFRLVTLGGKDLRGRKWKPGEKLQVIFSGWEQRAYTPVSWDATEGTTTFVAYVHGNGIGSAWIASLDVGAQCNIVGPRDAVDLTMLRRPGVLFGDETSFGTAAALRATASGERDVTFIFEVASVAESRAVLDRLNVDGEAILIQRDAEERHLDELERLVVATFRSNPATHGILTGKATSIQRLYKALRRVGVSARQVKNAPYWAPGRRGLE